MPADRSPRPAAGDCRAPSRGRRSSAPGRITRTAPHDAPAGARAPALAARRGAAPPGSRALGRPRHTAVPAVDLRDRDDLRGTAQQPERDNGGRAARRRRPRSGSRAPAGRAPSTRRVEAAREIVLRDAQGAEPACERRQVESLAAAASRRQTARSRSWRRSRAHAVARRAIDAPPCAMPALARTSARPRTQSRSLTPVPGSESRIAPGANGLAAVCRPDRSRSARSPDRRPRAW